MNLKSNPFFSAGKSAWEVEQQQLAKARSLADKWREVSRRIELWVDIQVYLNINLIIYTNIHFLIITGTR